MNDILFIKRERGRERERERGRERERERERATCLNLLKKWAKSLINHRRYVVLTEVEEEQLGCCLVIKRRNVSTLCYSNYMRALCLLSHTPGNNTGVFML